MSVDERVILLESGFGAGTRGRNGSCVRVVPRETRVMVWKPCVESSTTSRNNHSTNLMVIEIAFDSASAM